MGPLVVEFHQTSIWLNKIEKKRRWSSFVVGGPEAGFDPQEEIHFMAKKEGDLGWINMKEETLEESASHHECIVAWE